MELIRCKDLSLGYEGRTVAKHISFTLSEGEYLCIVGENGSGKTTLVRTLLGLQQPLSGTIERSAELKKKGIGYLPQQTPVQRDFPATVEEIVMSGFLAKSRLRPFYSRAERELASREMERLGILEIKKQCFRELSGGQQRRVLLARALCAQGGLLLLDEPMAGLDPQISDEMYGLIKELNREDKITIVMVSHDVSAVLSYATHVLHVLHENAFFGTVSEYEESEFNKTLKRGGGVCSQS